MVSVLFENGSCPKIVVLENGSTFDLREMLGSMMLGGAIRAFSLARSMNDSSVLDDLGLLPDLLIGWAFTVSFLFMSFSPKTVSTRLGMGVTVERQMGIEWVGGGC